MANETVKEKWKNEVVGWEQFSSEVLMKNDIINGILLISSNGQLVSKNGKLSDVRTEELLQFTTLFKCTNEDKNVQVFQKGLKLTFGNTISSVDETIKYSIIRKSLHSLYATSRRNQFGLIIINLAYGILIGSHCHPVTSAVASSYLENAAELLRK